jgi:glycosyltransferase involved in cell wall biosynthesis
VFNQTYPNVEIIVVDDHSDTDFESFRKKYPKIKFYRNIENRGGCYSRNRGIKESTGVYVNFLDDDDELLPGKIEHQVKKFQESNQSNLGFVTAHAEDNRSGQKIIKLNKVQGDIYRQLLKGYAISGIETLLIKRECLIETGGFDKNLKSSQEYDLMIRLSEKYDVDYVDQVLSREHRSSNQISLNFDKKISGAKYLFKKHNQRYRDIGTLFWMKMRLKLFGLICRYYIGKFFGERAYRLTILN